MNTFCMNGICWKVLKTHTCDDILIDRTGKRTLGVADPLSKTIYISNDVEENMVRKVLIHEIGHALMYSYGMLEVIHTYAKPSHWIDLEEFICNLLADHASEVIKIADNIFI